MTDIRIPWPPATLSPNNRAHWATKARAKASARKAAFFATKEAKATAPADGPIALSITAYPPVTRAHDRDNLMARLKASLDGVAQALGVDDVRFRPGEVQIGPRKPGGEVVVRIMGAAE